MGRHGGFRDAEAASHHQSDAHKSDIISSFASQSVLVSQLLDVQHPPVSQSSPLATIPIPTLRHSLYQTLIPDLVGTTPLSSDKLAIVIAKTWTSGNFNFVDCRDSNLAPVFFCRRSLSSHFALRL